MKSYLTQDRWSPYLLGIFIAILSWITILFMDHSIGTTVTFVKATALLENLFSPQHVQENTYFRNYLVGYPIFNWHTLFVIGIFFGSLLAGSLSGTTQTIHVPKIWGQAFGPSKTKRMIGAFIGGFLLLFGARFAGGCTSGHGLSGSMQMATSGWVFMLSLFATGIPTAFLLYRTKKTSHPTE